MKFASTALLFMIGTAAMASAELRGSRKLERSHKDKSDKDDDKEARRIPSGVVLEDLKATETPAEEINVLEPPAEETPAEETPAEETPEDDEKATETPAEEINVLEPPAEETPVEETPEDDGKATETPAEEIIVLEPPAEETPAEDTSAEQEPKPIETEDREPLICTPVITSPLKSVEYVVLQYNSTIKNKINFKDEEDQDLLNSFYQTAYELARGSCDQNGARDNVFATEFLAHNKDDSTFMLRVGRVSNAIATIFSAEINENCGPILYNTTDPGAVDFVDRRRRRLEEEVVNECACPVPTASEVLAKYNEVMVNEFSNTELAAFMIGSEQLCEDLECKPDKKGETTFDSTGVCLGDIEELSSWEPSESPTEQPSDEPSEIPTESASPTDLPTSEPSSEPTSSPSAEPTTSPTAEPTSTPVNDPTASPSSEPTASPSSEPTVASVDPVTTAPVADPVTTAPVADPVTTAPVADPVTTAPVADPVTTAPVADPTDEPTAEPTLAPVADPTDEPTAEPTLAPVADPTEDPTATPVEPDTEAPVTA